MDEAAKQRVKERFRKRFYPDYGLFLIVLFLLTFGLIMLLSVSSYESKITFGDSNTYFYKQLKATAIGLVMMLITTFIPYGVYKRFTGIAYVFSGLILLSVKTSFAYSANGATRWVRVAGISIQPAEISKTLMIIALAGFISELGKRVSTLRGFVLTLVMSLIPAAAVYGLTKNLSSAFIIVSISLIMLFVSCPNYARFVVLGLIGAGLAFLAVFRAVNAPSPSDLGFRSNRILAWLHPENYAAGKGMQTVQALYAIGSGGLFGKGLGESMQKLGYLPEAQNDMIFSIVCEELGLFGAAAIIVLFIMLIYRLRSIADAAPDMFSALLVVGVMGHIAVQVILNIAVVTNTIPNTGITLPFFSNGGSAVIMQLIEIGIASGVAFRTPVSEVH
ncbi:FtsW/RodA/SpoVE family cell cycle protein [Butyrivibrio sp. MC2013]|uniref:FtsW/RodA/SpoVE family cell cycle protein n=1 Tax=Butyrivibrio sp. MC2013 TaxID=1280686 RepID=UPI000423BD38|nr:putative peptidoglycan glycosyltransferase FtsW [Butyrivibrio sp. MC2013]